MIFIDLVKFNCLKINGLRAEFMDKNYSDGEIYFIKEGISLRLKSVETILEAEIEAGLVPDAPCGGQGKCGKCKVRIEDREVLACQTPALPGMRVETLKSGEAGGKILMEGSSRSILLSPGSMTKEIKHPMIGACDVGTTTVVAYLVDGLSGERLATESTLNPQRQYGADVVSRGNYVLEHPDGGAKELSGCIREAVNELFLRAARHAKRNPKDIVRIAMVGNSPMHHLFLEIPVDTLMVAPYEPKVKKALRFKGEELGLSVSPDAEVLWLPNIGGFVGADTVGCILSSGIFERKDLTLIVDIGTNGEVVLGNKDRILVCSTAAGPAFEGAKISCGMRGSIGAIDHVHLENDKLIFHVIGNTLPTGICGSGLLDAAACFLEKGLIDETGRLNDTYYFTKDVFINQKDIRKLQLAKAAISAGIRLLVRYREIELRDIGRLLLAGAFGNYLDPVSACRIGLIPSKLQGKITAIGNAAGEGALISAMNEEEYQRSLKLGEQSEFFELACDPDFEEVFVDELYFPR